MSISPQDPVLSDADPRFTYTTITGYFAQDDPATNATSFDYTQNFGLVDRAHATNDTKSPMLRPQWESLARDLHTFNTSSPPGTSHKLLYLARHGQGVHNVAESLYGTASWDAHWSKLSGNDTLNWVDARLTTLGISQAQRASSVWASLITNGIPLPQSYYVSPLDRCLATARHTFAGLALPNERAYKPVVKEMVREVLGVHTCDQRSTKKEILDRYPEATFEEGFTEGDELWQEEHRESDEEIDVRIRGLLDDVFANDKGEVISFTSHSGAIASFLRVLGHRTFRLATGAVIPVLVKAERTGV